MSIARALAVALLTLAACWQPILHPPVSPSGVVAVAAVALAGLAVALWPTGRGSPRQ